MLAPDRATGTVTTPKPADDPRVEPSGFGSARRRRPRGIGLYGRGVGPLLEPVGPLATRTYWRRRGVLIAVLLIVLWLITRLVGGDGGSASAADDGAVSVTQPRVGTQTPSPGPSAPSTDPGAGDAATNAPPAPGAVPPTPPGTSPPTLVAVPPCNEAELTLAVTADTERYAPEAKPKLTVAVGTSGAVPCTRELGPAGLGVVITSGQDRIWGSQDCSSAPTDVRVLMPGTPVNLDMTWDRVRSQPGCASAGAPARAGTYLAIPVAGEGTGDPTSFLLD